MTKNTDPSTPIIAIQSWLRPALTAVPCNIDYQRFADTLESISALLRDCALEDQAVDIALSNLGSSDPVACTRHAEFAITSLRVAVLRHLLGMPSYRDLSRMISSSNLLADFCGLHRIDGIRGAAKSTLERRCRMFSQEQLKDMLNTLTILCSTDLSRAIGLEEPIAMDVCLIDSTCLDAHIHYPIDWVLFKDVSLTLLKAVRLIRNQRLKVRMPYEPEQFQSRMNKLCMEMTHARRRKNAKAERKRILRQMKQWLKAVAAHGQSHRDKLEQLHEDTDLSANQVARILERMDKMLELVPKVIHQAHERIIGARQVKNKDKVLSVHDSDVNVVVRGKAGRQVEYGNTLTLCENRSGYITDWCLYRNQAPSEAAQLKESLQRQIHYPIRNIGSDRGFASKAISRLLEKRGIYDATCPRSVCQLRQRREEPLFRDLQRRRASTEARIATLLNRWIGGRVRCRSYDKRANDVGWAVLSHNLWFIARMLSEQRKKKDKAA